MQSSDSVLDGITSRKEQDGSFFAAAAQLGKHRPPVLARKQYIENNQIIIASSSQVEAARALFGHINYKTVLGEAFPEICRCLLLIFNNHLKRI
jgi:hypothetical protein